MILPELNETTCTGCEDCVKVCPAFCLESHQELPWLPRPGDCIACGLCELVCPTAAIQMKQKQSS